MFGRKAKKQKIDELEERLVALAKKVEENNHDIGELRGKVYALERENENLLQELAAVGERQQTFRQKLIEVSAEDVPFGNPKFDPMGNLQVPLVADRMFVDHICVGIDGNTGVSSACIYCHPELVKEAENNPKLSYEIAEKIRERIANGEDMWGIADEMLLAHPVVVAIHKKIIFREPETCPQCGSDNHINLGQGSCERQ